MRSYAASLLAAAAFILAAAGSASAAPVPCVNGMAAGYPCDKVDMLAKLPLTAVGAGPTDTGNDVWGWTDPITGKEYAILGLYNATSFVDISDPVNPVYLGRLLAPPPVPALCVPAFGPLAGPGFRPQQPLHEECAPPTDPSARASENCSGNSLWRDHEVYNDHVFIGSEQGNHGLVVFDLTRLRNVPNPPVDFTQNARYCGYGKSHTTTINTQTGFLYANGANQSTNVCFGSGPIIVDIRNPDIPLFAGCDNADGYTHDSQCIVYQGPDVAHQGHSICLKSNEDTLTISNVTNPLAPLQLSRTGYAGRGYTHQGWITADHRYFLLDDELDEENFGHNTKTYIWDLLDLETPQLIGTHFGPTAAIDHQQFVYGNFDYQSNYRAGLRILETKDVAAGQLTEVGYFDVYPPDNIADYGGTWANYPFFHSGAVAITTIGPPYGTMAAEFFVLRPLFADLALTVSDSPDPVVLGQNVTYTFTVGNQGPTYASSATLRTRLSVGLAFVSITPSQGTCTGTSAITCDLGRIDNGEAATVRLVARVDTPALFTNSGRASVSAVETDTRRGDNAAVERTSIIR